MTAKIDLIIQILKSEPGRIMKTRDLACELLSRFPDKFKSKTDNPRLKSKNDVINQIAAEVGGHKQEQFDKRNSGVLVSNDRPRTFVYTAETTNTTVSHPEGKTRLIDIIADCLKERPGVAITIKEISEMVYAKAPERYREKLQDPNFGTEKSIVASIAASFGKQRRLELVRDYPFTKEHDTTPITLSWEDNATSVSHQSKELEHREPSPDNDNNDWDGKEESLYSIFNKYLHEHHKLYPMRIDEKRSKNQRGKGGNEWLYPDIVALHPMDKEWAANIRQCANRSYGEVINLWSFEVKKALSTGNVRKCYFQAVSNSSWANYGYLVATSIDNQEVLRELKMPHSLHGIGVILMDPIRPEMTKVILPAEKRDQVDWLSANRLAEENSDFMEFTANTSDYLQTKRLKGRDWHMQE